MKTKKRSKKVDLRPRVELERNLRAEELGVTSEASPQQSPTGFAVWSATGFAVWSATGFAVW